MRLALNFTLSVLTSIFMAKSKPAEAKARAALRGVSVNTCLPDLVATLDM